MFWCCCTSSVEYCEAGATTQPWDVMPPLERTYALNIPWVPGDTRKWFYYVGTDPASTYSAEAVDGTLRIGNKLPVTFASSTYLLQCANRLGMQVGYNEYFEFTLKDVTKSNPGEGSYFLAGIAGGAVFGVAYYNELTFPFYSPAGWHIQYRDPIYRSGVIWTPGEDLTFRADRTAIDYRMALYPQYRLHVETSVNGVPVDNYDTLWLDYYLGSNRLNSVGYFFVQGRFAEPGGGYSDTTSRYVCDDWITYTAA